MALVWDDQRMDWVDDQQPSPNAIKAGSGTTPTTPAATTPPRPTFDGDLDKAKGIADDMLKGVSPTHISDPRAAETNEYLKLLKDRLGGLDSKEMLAAKEQGLADLQAQTAQNLERYASIAGAQGVRGGAAAALQGRALNESNKARAGLERQLILDNVAAKDRAMQAYGGQLNTVTDRELGINQYNAGADDRMTMLKLGLPFQIMSGLGSYRAADDAAASNADATSLARDYINKLDTQGKQQPNGTSATGNQYNILDESEKYRIDSSDKALAGVAEELKGVNTMFGGTGAQLQMSELLPKAQKIIREKIDLMYPDEPDSRKAQLADQEFDSWVQNQLGAKGFSYTKGKTIICTAAFEQGRISELDLATTRLYRERCMTFGQYKGYLRWARPVVAGMRRYPNVVTPLVMLFLPSLIAAMRWEMGETSNVTLYQRFVLGAVKAANYLGATSFARRMRKAFAHG